MPTNRTRTSNAYSTTRFRNYRVTRYGEVYDLFINMSYDGVTSVIKDVNHPGFKKTNKPGMVVLDDVDLVRSRRTYTPGFISHPYIWNATSPMWATQELSGDLANYYVEPRTGAASIPAFQSLNAQQAVLVKAYAKINESPLMVGEALADLDKTIGMLRRPFKGIVNLIGEIASRKSVLMKKKGQTAIKASANAWLEKQYGWGPLLNDCHEIIKQSIEKRVSCERPLLVARSATQLSNKASGVIPETDGSGSGYRLYWIGSWSSTMTLRVSAGVLYSVYNNTGRKELSDIMGSRARDVIPTLWEMTPYSFVADQVIGISDWLQAVNPDPRVIFIGNWVTLVESLNTTCGGSTVNRNPAGDIMRGSLGTSERSSLKYKRLVNQRLPRTPVPKHQFYALNAVNDLALAIGPITKGLAKLKH